MMMAASNRSGGSKDLYTYGAGVHVPSLELDEERGRQGLAVVRNGERGRELRRRRHTIGGCSSSEGNDGGRMLQEHLLGQLRHSMAFTEDVVSSRSPHSLTYSQARGRLSDVFLPSLPQHNRRHGKKSERSLVVGPYETKRHLCCLTGPPPSTTITSHPPLLPLTTKPTSSSSIKPSTSGCAAPTHTISTSIPSYLSEMLYRRMKVVPASQSVDWKQRTLAQVSSSTAFHLGGHRRRLQEKKEKKEDNEITERDFDSHEGGIMDEEEEELEARKKDYTHFLERGVRPIWRKGREDLIVLDNNTTFTKVLMKNYPQPHSEWCDEKEEEGEEGIVRGGRRWRALPLPAPSPDHLRWVVLDQPDKTDIMLGEDQLSSEKSLLVPGVNSDRYQQRKYCQILKEWCRCRAIHVQPDESTKDGILENLGSLKNSSKIRGAVACISLSEQHQIIQSPSSNTTLSENEATIIATALENVLNDDEAKGVHIPAALALLSIGRSGQLATETLLNVIKRRETDDIDEWAGLQTLVEIGVCEDDIVKNLQKFLLNSSESLMREKAGNLMVRLSDKMPLVHALLAEQLTSRGWLERLSACNIIPSLLCPISSDVCSRLVVMSWEDWSGTVRDAASKALGTTGHGHLLHDELARRLSEGNEIQRLDALKKINSIELMTPQLLSAFLPSLSDQHASIRVEAIAICGKLAVRDEGVLQGLLRLLGDPIWTIRAHTIRALMSIGYRGGDVVEQLLWSVGCDKSVCENFNKGIFSRVCCIKNLLTVDKLLIVPAVRAEACNTLSHLLKKEDEEVEEGEEEEREELNSRAVSTLRERLVVEDDAMVIDQLVLALRQLGGSVIREDPMTDFIVSEVKRLGTCQAIIEGVTKGERRTLTDYIINRPLTCLTTRDYLTPNQRHKFYSLKHQAIGRGVAK